MAKVNVAAQLENFDQRLVRVEQILPTLATKDDLKAFATKEDLKAFATKEDLKAFATKEDLEAFATKEDLKAFATQLEAFATKEDLVAMRDELRRHMDIGYEQLHSDIELLAEHVARLATKVFEQ
jgi:hypothetical protein